MVFAAIIFYIGAAASIFMLRKKYPDLPRPYKTWGYPALPIIYITALLILLMNTLVNRPVESLAGLGIVALGIPAYFFGEGKSPNWRRWKAHKYLSRPMLKNDKSQHDGRNKKLAPGASFQYCISLCLISA